MFKWPEQVIVFASEFDVTKDIHSFLVAGITAEGPLYRRFEERHVQHAFEADNIDRRLVKLDWDVLCLDFDTVGKPADQHAGSLCLRRWHPKKTKHDGIRGSPMDERVSPGVVDRVAYRNRESRRLLDRAAKSVAKGASSTMRVLDYHLPLVIDRADGAHVWDADGNELIDMNMGYGPLIFGHRSPIVIGAIEAELRQRGTQLGFADALSFEVAELVKESVPSIDLLRFTSTGTEAAQTAVRLARAFTNRSKIVLFEGHYHGSSDATFHRIMRGPMTSN